MFQNIDESYWKVYDWSVSRILKESEYIIKCIWEYDAIKSRAVSMAKISSENAVKDVGKR